MKAKEFEERAVAVFGNSWMIPFSNITGHARPSLYRWKKKDWFPKKCVESLILIEDTKSNIRKN